MSLLELSSQHQVSVIEMGMNHLGEIKTLCDIARPDVVGVTMIGRAHIGELGSQENIARAKNEIYENSPNAVKVFNLDNEWTLQLFEKHRAQFPQERLWTFSGFREDVDVFLRITSMSLKQITVQGRIDLMENKVNIPLYGRHNAVNLMAASALALASGISAAEIWTALPKLKTAWGRNQLLKIPSGAEVLFDGYNANPDSVAALLRNFYETQVEGKKVVVLGEMLELGAETASSHREIGELAGQIDCDVVWFLGPSCEDFRRGISSTNFSKKLFITNGYEEKVARTIALMLQPGDVAVVKGSRGSRLEQVVLAWEPIDFQPK